MTQLEYLEILFADLQFSRSARQKYLSLKFRREIKYLDDLLIAERSLVIGELKKMKEERNGPRPTTL